jgi:hypothetical protein
MILKTTLNQLQDFFSKIIQKTILFATALFEQKVWLFTSNFSQISTPSFTCVKSHKESVFDILKHIKTEKLKAHLLKKRIIY